MDSRTQCSPRASPLCVLEHHLASRTYLRKAFDSATNKHEALPVISSSSDQPKDSVNPLMSVGRRSSSLYSQASMHLVLDVSDKTELMPPDSASSRCERIPSFGTFVARVPSVPAQRPKPTFPRIIIPQSRSRRIVIMRTPSDDSAPHDVPCEIASAPSMGLQTQTAPWVVDQTSLSAGDECRNPLLEAQARALAVPSEVQTRAVYGANSKHAERSASTTECADSLLQVEHKRNRRQNAPTWKSHAISSRFSSRISSHPARYSEPIPILPMNTSSVQGSPQPSKSMAQLTLRTQMISRRKTTLLIPRSTSKSDVGDGIDRADQAAAVAYWSDDLPHSPESCQASTAAGSSSECDSPYHDSEDDSKSLSALSRSSSWRRWMVKETADTARYYAQDSRSTVGRTQPPQSERRGASTGHRLPLASKHCARSSSISTDTMSQTTDGLPSPPITVYRVSQMPRMSDARMESMADLGAKDQSTAVISVLDELVGICRSARVLSHISTTGSSFSTAELSSQFGDVSYTPSQSPSFEAIIDLAELESPCAADFERKLLLTNESVLDSRRFSWEPTVDIDELQWTSSTSEQPEAAKAELSSGNKLLHQPIPMSPFRCSLIKDPDSEPAATRIVAHDSSATSSTTVVLESDTLPAGHDEDSSSGDGIFAGIDDDVDAVDRNLVPPPLAPTMPRSQIDEHSSDSAAGFREHRIRSLESAQSVGSSVSTVRPTTFKPAEEPVPVILVTDEKSNSVDQLTLSKTKGPVQMQMQDAPQRRGLRIVTSAATQSSRFSNQATCSASSDESLMSDLPSLCSPSDDSSSPTTSVSDSATSNESGLSFGTLRKGEWGVSTTNPRVQDAWQQDGIRKSWFSIDILPESDLRKPWEKSRCGPREQPRQDSDTPSCLPKIADSERSMYKNGDDVVGNIRVMRVKSPKPAVETVNLKHPTSLQSMTQMLLKIRKHCPTYMGSRRSIRFETILDFLRSARKGAVSPTRREQPGSELRKAKQEPPKKAKKTVRWKISRPISGHIAQSLAASSSRALARTSREALITPRPQINRSMLSPDGNADRTRRPLISRPPIPPPPLLAFDARESSNALKHTAPPSAAPTSPLPPLPKGASQPSVTRHTNKRQASGTMASANANKFSTEPRGMKPKKNDTLGVQSLTVPLTAGPSGHSAQQSAFCNPAEDRGPGRARGQGCSDPLVEPCRSPQNLAWSTVVNMTCSPTWQDTVLQSRQNVQRSLRQHTRPYHVSRGQ